MNKYLRILLVFGLLVSSVAAFAQNAGNDVFAPISKYIEKGDADKLSAWFANSLEISLLSNTNNSSKSQAKQIVKSFFEAHTPRSFTITHMVSKGNMKYALGELNAGGEMFQVTVFVSYVGDTYKIQQLKIDRID